MVHFYLRIFTFFVGVLVGILLAIKCRNYTVKDTVRITSQKRIPSYDTWFKNQGFKKREILWDNLRYDKHNYVTESHFLYNNVRVLCIILVSNLKNKEAVGDTWGKGCNSIKFLVINNKGSSKSPSIKRTKEKSSWILLCKALQDTRNEYDWILVVYDDTFAILENLRYYVAGLNSSDKYYLGHASSFWNTVYNAGQAGYVLSRGSLQAFKDKLKVSDCSTNAYWNREDFYLGKFLSTIEIRPIDTKDSEGLSMFHPYDWYHVFFPGESYYKNSVYPAKCCSKNSITFRAIEGDKMYTYYYLLYTLQIFLNGKLGNREPVNYVPEDQVWKQFLRERNIPSDNITGQQYYKVWEDLVKDPSSFAAHMKMEVHFDYN